MKKPEDMTPAEINAEIEDLEEQRGNINARLGALRLRLALVACPYQVGEVLANRHGDSGRIVEIYASRNIAVNQGYALRGVYLKKDGSPARNPGRDNTRLRICDFNSWEDWKRPEGGGRSNGI